MPGGFPLGLELCNANDQGSGASARGTQVTTSATANTYGSWTQLVASTPSDTTWMIVSLNGGQSSSDTLAAQVGVGASGSEQVIAADLIGNYAGASVGGWAYFSFPCTIPAGTRIAVRSASAVASDFVYAALLLLDGAFTMIEGAAGVDSLGFLSASTTGTTVTNGVTNATKGSYAQLTASTSRDYLGLLLGYDHGQTTLLASYYQVDIAVGGAGSEQVILPNLPVGDGDVGGPYFVPIPAGTRVAARSQGTGSLTVNVTAYGIYQ